MFDRSRQGTLMALPHILRNKLRLPVVGAPLFIVSHPALVIAQCKAGIVGAFPALNARPISQLDEWLHEITEALAAHDRAHPERPAAPFAVNQIVHKSNTRLEEDIALTVKWKAPIVITSLGAREDVNAAVHGYGGLTLHDIINNRFAHKAIEKGADGLIAVAAGAGGHAGSTSPFALVQDIRAWFDGPLLLSGAIATGRAVLAAQVMGADLAYIGSAFVATPEARAIEDYKQAIVAGDASDIIGSTYFTGVFGNYLKPSIVRSGLDPESLPERDAKAMSFASASSSSSEAEAWRDIWGSGQGIGAVKSVQPVAELVARLEREYAEAKRAVKIRRPAAVATVEIIDRLFVKPVEIVENGVARKVGTLEAILMRLWAAELSGSKRAGKVRLQFQELVEDDKEREIIIEETLAKNMTDWPGRTTHG